MRSAEEIRKTLRAHILTSVLRDESPSSLKDDMPLRSGGVLDSLATLALVTFIEQEFGVELEAHDTSVGSFDTIDDVVALVMRKQATAGRG